MVALHMQALLTNNHTTRSEQDLCSRLPQVEAPQKLSATVKYGPDRSGGCARTVWIVLELSSVLQALLAEASTFI